MQLPVYLDYAAATPADPKVVETMTACLTLDGNFGNPASRPLSVLPSSMPIKVSTSSPVPSSTKLYLILVSILKAKALK